MPNFPVSSAHYQHELPAFATPELSGEAFAEFLGGRRLALIFGNESDGISKGWTPFADLYCYVPMTGFVESLNLSVCAGMLLGKLKEVIDSEMIPQWSEGLTPNEREYLFDHWCLQTFARTRSLVDNKAPELKEYFRNMATGSYFSPFVP